MSLAAQSLCNGLIRRSIELRALYRHAAKEVSEPGLRTVLNEEAQSLDHVIAELQAQLSKQTFIPATRSRMIGRARQHFDTLLVRSMHRSDDAWIRVLARNEKRLLKAYERALGRIASGEMTVVLHRQLPRLQSIDMDMHSLAKAIGS